MSYCGQQTLVKTVDHVRHIASVRCRSWSCPDCAPDRKRELIAQCHGGTPNTFLTLTHRRVEGITPNQAALRLSRAWRILRLRVLRKCKMKKLAFISVMEAHQSGWPHLHILLRSIWLDQRWLSEQMSNIIDSPIVHIKRIDHRASVNAYVAKYAGKAAHKFGTAKRYWQSPDYDLRPKRPEKTKPRPGEGWERQTFNLIEAIRIYKFLGFEVTQTSAWRAIARPPPRAGSP